MTEAELMREYALDQLINRYPGQKIEIITAFDIAWSGWEFDYQGALITRDGAPELVIIDQTSGDDRTVREILEAKIDEYDRLAAETKHVLAQHMVLEGLREFATEPPQPGDEMSGRARLFDDLSRSNGGRVLRELADEYPDAEGTGDLVTDLGLPSSTRTLWALLRGINAILDGLSISPAQFARDAGFPEQEGQNICDGRIGHVTLERVIEIYDAAALKSGWLMVRVFPVSTNGTDLSL